MEDFVNIELAIKLKELGFNIPFFFYYRTDDKKLYHLVRSQPLVYGKDIIDNEVVIAPTIAQVLKWLREEKSIYVVPCVIDDCDTDADFRIINRFTFWSFDIQIIETADYIYAEYTNIGSKRFDFYEEAALAGIEYVLENLI